MPLGPLEAVVSALPTILSDIPGHQFLDEYAALFPLTALNDGAKALEDTITQIAADGSSLFERSEERTVALRDRYSLEEMTRRYEAIYSDLD
jgi:glycosyltransferase involved in cell wall biosynthesis